MELFFLCTIIMAIVSFISMALSKPVDTVSSQPAIISEADTTDNPESEASIIEFKVERELVSLASA